jgi:hypothetical protein
MTLLRRRPREVYRVYSEEEYLNGAGSGLASIAEWPVDEPPRAVETVHQDGTTEHRLRRVAGVTVLAGTLGAVGAVVCLNLARAHDAGTAGRESLVAATRPVRAAGSSPAADDARPLVESSRPVIVRPVGTVGSRVPSRSGRSREGGPALRRSDRLPAHATARRPAGIAVLVDYARRRPPAGEAPAAPVSAPAQAPAPTASSPAQPASEAADTTTAAVSAPPAHPAPETQAEFGFER